MSSFLKATFDFIFPKSRVTGRRPFLVASILFVSYLTLFSPRAGHEASGADIGRSTLVSDQIIADDVNKKMRLLAERKKLKEHKSTHLDEE
ncbi:hypothetical protein C9374_012853 [Naegleria lovaniensis]|uniref:Uncharacterized protein n=1 Tax=Naegleria lovaniensis TaxID=51637 RepID=A0AA88GAV4_NAELO|nr:uncharacterized protein C9374_012853 [Naegleria lovaniensis]KAG2373121.1 hypothetical protein C9374_012853 [Naegleria lovaniensis]